MNTQVSYILLSFVVIVLLYSCADKMDCSVLKRGEFYYKSKIAFAGSSIERNDSIQIVTDSASGKKQKERIEWTGPCTYMLYPIEETDSLSQEELSPMKVEVQKVTGKYYTVHVSSEFYKADFNDTVWIVK